MNPMNEQVLEPVPAQKRRGIVGWIGLAYSAATVLTFGLIVLLKPG